MVGKLWLSHCSNGASLRSGIRINVWYVWANVARQLYNSRKSECVYTCDMITVQSDIKIRERDKRGFRFSIGKFIFNNYWFSMKINNEVQLKRSLSNRNFCFASNQLIKLQPLAIDLCIELILLRGYWKPKSGIYGLYFEPLVDLYRNIYGTCFEFWPFISYLSPKYCLDIMYLWPPTSIKRWKNNNKRDGWMECGWRSISNDI